MAERTTRKPIPKNVRVDDDLWDRFGVATTKHGIDRSTALRQFMRWYVRDPDSPMPRRPESATRSDDD